MTTAVRELSGSVERRFAIVGVLFFLSGFSALTYQTTWQRMLGLFSGSDAISVSIVVGTFLLGLGVGSLLASTIADRVSARSAILAFAECELGIAGFAALSKAVFYDFLFGHMVAISGNRAVVLLAVFLALLVPTVLMGLSLPFLARGLVQNIGTAAQRIGFLYTVNTLGAATGAFVAGFLIIGTIGYEPTIYLAAVVNVAVGITALLVARGAQPASSAMNVRGAILQGGVESARNTWGWSLLVFISGFVIISLELIWFRAISIILTSSAYSFAWVLGCFLLGDALGVFAGTNLLDRFKAPRLVFLSLQAALVLFAVAALWLIAFILSWEPGWNLIHTPAHIFYDVHWGPDPLTFGTVMGVFLTVSFIVIPAAFLSGLSIPVIQKAVQNDIASIGRKVAWIQVANIAGNAAGSFVTGLIFLEWLGTAGTLRVLVIIGIVFAVASLTEIMRNGLPARARFGGAALILVLPIVFIGFPSDHGFWKRVILSDSVTPNILGEDRTGIAMFDYAKDIGGKLYLGGKLQSEIPFGAGHVFLGMLGPLVNPKAQSALVVGLGSGGTAYGVGAGSAIKHVRVVEILAPVYDVMRKFGARTDGLAVDRPFKDLRYRLTVGDARHVLFTEPEKYDIIEQDPLAPHDSYAGLLYSVEYFRQVRSRLNPGGICVQWVPLPRIRNTFVSVFPYVVQIGKRMIGSSQPIRYSRDAVLERFREKTARTYVKAAGTNFDDVAVQLLYGEMKSWGPKDTRPKDVDTDLFPKDELYLTRENLSAP